MKLNKKVINDLQNCDFFCRCSCDMSEISHLVEKAPNIDVATMSLVSNEWEVIRFDARGDVTEHLSRFFAREYNSFWNKGVQQIRSSILPQIEPMLLLRIKALNMDDRVYSHIRMDIINMIMVLSYRDFVRSDFYENMLDIYLHGYLPCGWIGDYPAGKMIAY